MKITNLEHVQSVSTSDVLGGRRGGNSTSVTIDISKYFKFHGAVVAIHGNIAEADAGALAFGRNTDTYTHTQTQVVEHHSSASSSSSGSYTG